MRRLACMQEAAGASASAAMAAAASAAVGRSCGFERRHRRASSAAPSGHSSGTLQGNRCSAGEIGIRAVFHKSAQHTAEVLACGMAHYITQAMLV